MADEVVYPQIWGANWPSHLLAARLRLRALGVPDENIRFLPYPGHFADPEVREGPNDGFGNEGESAATPPRGPQYDPATGRVTVTQVDPETIRPRLRVNVRAETVTHFDANGRVAREETVGRLAHFWAPMMADLPGTVSGAAITAAGDGPAETPVARIARQVCERYPELVATVAPDVRATLERVAGVLAEGLDLPDAAARRQLVPRLVELVLRGPAPAECRSVFVTLAQKPAARGEDNKEAGPSPENTWSQFVRLADALFHPDPVLRAQQLVRFLDAQDGDEETAARAGLRALLHRVVTNLAREDRRERAQVVRELIEILTTEAFRATAASDNLWGIGWVHGQLSDVHQGAAPLAHDGLLLGVTGGQEGRALLARQMQIWAAAGSDGFLGVRQRTAEEEPHSSDCFALNVFDEAETQELWAMVAWRREARDPLPLFEQACRRLVHPETTARLTRDAPAPSRLDTLFAQPGATAVLGGRSWLHFPGVTICVPLAERADEEATRAGEKLAVLVRLFLPVCLRVEIIWREGLARLGSGPSASYLHHDFQGGVWLADDWTVIEQEAREKGISYDPVTL